MLASVVAVLAPARRGCVRWWRGGTVAPVVHAKTLLGIKVVLDGTLPQGPVLVAMKHESFFEAIDTPRLFAYPSVFRKTGIVRHPRLGPFGADLRLDPGGARQGRQRPLRAMIALAKERVAEADRLIIFPEGTRSGAWCASGFCRRVLRGFLQAARPAGGAIAVDSGRVYHHVVKRPGRITYKIGEPIPAGLPREEVEARVQRGDQCAEPDSRHSSPHTRSKQSGCKKSCCRVRRARAYEPRCAGLLLQGDRSSQACSHHPELSHRPRCYRLSPATRNDRPIRSGW